MRIPVLFAWLALMALLILSLPWLPAMVGTPGKEAPRLMYLLTLALPATVLPLLDFVLLPWLVRHTPMLVNMPHRSYWLAPERREASLLRLQDQVAWLALLVLALLAGVHGFTLARAHGLHPHRAMVWICGAAWAAAFLIRFVLLHRAFPRPPKA